MDFDANIPHQTDMMGFIRKRRHLGMPSMRLSDVKGSEIARAIDPKLATVNLFASDNESVMSQEIQHAASDTAPLLRVKDAYHAPYFISDLNLAKYMSYDTIVTKRDNLKDEFIEQWLAVVSLGVLDYWSGNNFMYFYNYNNQISFKAFDFECCMNIVTEDDKKECNTMVNRASNSYESGFYAAQVKYLKAKFPLVTKNFFDKLLAVPLESICDFTKIKVPFEKLNLEQMSERATEGYKARFKMLADQFAGEKATTK
jgi:hypothetical protein